MKTTYHWVLHGVVIHQVHFRYCKQMQQRLKRVGQLSITFSLSTVVRLF